MNPLALRENTMKIKVANIMRKERPLEAIASKILFLNDI